MPDNDLPVVKYVVRHLEGEEGRTHPCVHLITFGSSYGKTEVVGFHVVLELDLSKNQAPPENLCERLTGQHQELSDSFFSFRKNEDEFHHALAMLRREIREEMKLQPPGRCIAFLINCTIGRHRSVAMAERLARAVATLEGSKAKCLHLDLRKGMKEQAQTAARVHFTELSGNERVRGHTRSKQKAKTKSEARVSERAPGRAASTADAALPPREAPLRGRKPSRGTAKPVERPYPRQRENVGRLVGPWRRDETRSRRLPS